MAPDYDNCHLLVALSTGKLSGDRSPATRDCSKEN